MANSIVNLCTVHAITEILRKDNLYTVTHNSIVRTAFNNVTMTTNACPRKELSIRDSYVALIPTFDSFKNQLGYTADIRFL